MAPRGENFFRGRPAARAFLRAMGRAPRRTASGRSLSEACQDQRIGGTTPALRHAERSNQIGKTAWWDPRRFRPPSPSPGGGFASKVKNKSKIVRFRTLNLQ